MVENLYFILENNGGVKEKIIYLFYYFLDILIRLVKHTLLLGMGYHIMLLNI